MTHDRRTIIPVSVFAALLLWAGPLVGDAHIATELVVRERLSAAHSERARDLVILSSVLETPSVSRAAGRVGVDRDALRRDLVSLSDAELHDLAQRATVLEPVAGGSDTDELLVVFLVVAIVALVLSAV